LSFLLPHFTAFSCIPLVWALLSDGPVRKTGNLQRIFFTIGVVNVILYVFFAVIVIVFNQTKSIVITKCGGISETTKLTNAQIAISIVYSVIISAISLTIAFGFIIYGRKFIIFGRQIFKCHKVVLIL